MKDIDWPTSFDDSEKKMVETLSSSIAGALTVWSVILFCFAIGIFFLVRLVDGFLGIVAGSLFFAIGEWVITKKNCRSFTISLFLGGQR